MEVKITCQYCDHKIFKIIYDQKSVMNIKCEKCGDRNLTVVDVAKDKIDTYAGSPPFEEKGSKSGYFNWGSGGD